MIELFEKNTFKVLALFSMSPGSRFTREEIKRRTRINNISLNNTINLLLSLKIFSNEGRLLSLNHSNAENNVILEIFSKHHKKLKNLPLNVYFAIFDITKEVAQMKNAGDVYLFGSYSKLVFREDSDIDIAVVSDNIDKKKLNSIISKLEKRHKKKIEVHYFSSDFYANRKDPLVKEIIQNGVKLI